MKKKVDEKKKSLKEYKSSYHKNNIFRPNDRVHWYEYSSDGIVVNGGYGTLIEIKQTTSVNYHATFFSILCDDGSIRELISNDVEPWAWYE